MGRGSEPSKHFQGKESEKVQKDRIEEPGGDYLNDILSFCGKWHTTLGSSRRGRIGVGASCFQSLGDLCEQARKMAAAVWVEVGRGG